MFKHECEADHWHLISAELSPKRTTAPDLEVTTREGLLKGLFDDLGVHDGFLQEYNLDARLWDFEIPQDYTPRPVAFQYDTLCGGAHA